ncbi:uncharacterized protein [Onthophagus taurus]|uniref:uncharacterized protein n=1 Tax=Onthophagus taurus TaxID=166361 RepID=UPI000C1FF3CC|nr:uncharacterized protein LOC111426295 [Onthophagus taurus]
MTFKINVINGHKTMNETVFIMNAVNYLKTICLIMISSWTPRTVRATVDVNLPELQYLADHLDPKECRKLVAALHFHSYDLPNNIEEAELRLAKDMSCIRLLLHWNGTPGEGKGETHEVLSRRLRQLGRQDLSDWLGRTVFHELGKDIERSLDAPFKAFLTTSPPKSGYGPQYVIDEKPTLPNFDWLPIDTISFTIIIVLLIVIIGLVCLAIFRRLCKNDKKKKSRKGRKRFGEKSGKETGSNSRYNRLNSDDEGCSCSTESDTESTPNKLNI